MGWGTFPPLPYLGSAPVRKICRLWWPKSLNPSSDLLLFGWFFASNSDSLDVVVATGVCPLKLSSSIIQIDLPEVLRLANKKMPTSLMECSRVSAIGYFAANFMDGKPYDLGTNNTNHSYSSCGCLVLNKIAEVHSHHFTSGNWIQLISSTCLSPQEDPGTPKLHHLHENGEVTFIYHIHVVLYEPPKFGRHHFSLNSWNSSMQEHMISPRTPNWVKELRNNCPVLDMDNIVLSMNCSYAVERILTEHLQICTCSSMLKTRSIFSMILRHFFSACAASVSTVFYIGLQLFHSCLNSRPGTLFCTLIALVFHHAWLNVNIRSSQFLYWPVFLQDGGSRSHSNVEYMHKLVLRKHTVWSSIVFDVILGFITGLFLLSHIQTIHYNIIDFSGQVTNNLLRSGCVWLMGVPAGFKLNTELAELFGIVSLNAIQIWSTLWFYMGSALPYAVMALALSGMTMGLTVLISLCIDMLKIATVHISVLHWLVSFIYTKQILALSSLWRLFRGRKWNPLRRRLDSFDYTVEEHVVGSLLFTPILLLLPTTSVFYIFFTMVNSFINIVCILIEIIVSLLHATPHAEILLWMLRKGRFPSGIWFELFPCSGSKCFLGSCNGHLPSNRANLSKNQSYIQETSTLVSVLCSNHATIGQILMPKLGKVFEAISMSSNFSLYGILSGQRIPSTLGTFMPPAMQWMNLPVSDYWRLCHESILEYGLYGT